MAPYGRARLALLAGIQGGVGIMLSTGDLSYLEAALDVGIESLRRRGLGHGIAAGSSG